MTLKDLMGDDAPEEPHRGRRMLPEVNRRGLEDHIDDDQDEPIEDDGTGFGRDDTGISQDGNGGQQPPSERFLDRMIKIRGVPKPKIGSKDPAFLMDPDFAEQYVLNSFDKVEQRKLWRRLMDVIHLAQGDGNEELVRSKAMSFAFRVFSHRARNDTTLELNERSAWIETRARTKQILNNQPATTQQSSGFLARLFGR